MTWSWADHFHLVMQSETPDSSPLLQPAIRRDLTSARKPESALCASTPLPLPSSSTRPPSTSPTRPSASKASTPPLGYNLWASEPTLRFPLPQGDQGLADWLSSSHPNIMMLPDPSDDTAATASAAAIAAAMSDSMSESFEIISATNTDTEDQDDTYAASISESVASLDFPRPDDVHSLAGTDRTYDEEESVPDTDSYRAETPFEDDDDDDSSSSMHYRHGLSQHNRGITDDEEDYNFSIRGRNENRINDRRNVQNENDNENNNRRSLQVYREHQDGQSTRDEDAEDFNESTFVHSQSSETTAVESLPETEDAAEENQFETDAARSLSSLQYTQQSLGTPSLQSTPEASRIVERPSDEPFGLGLGLGLEASWNASWNKKVNRFWEIEGQVKDYCMELTSAALPGMMFVLAFALALQLVHSSNKTALPAPAATPVVATMTTTETFTTTATATAIATAPAGAATTSSVASASPLPTSAPSSAGAFGLIPVGSVVSDDWLFGASKPVVSFAAQSQRGVLVRVPAKIKRTWQRRGCLTLTARRGDDLVDTVMSNVDEGIVVRFSGKDVHGVVTLVLEATCRPKVHKVVKVHFSRGLVEGALELTRSLAQDLSKLVPATAQEAERRLEHAKRSLDSVCQNVCVNLQSASETVAKTLGTTFDATMEATFGATLAETRRNLEDMASEALTQVKAAARGQVAEQLSRAQDLQDAMQLYLLDAQISAKLWWLRTTGSREEHDEYQKKAESFVALKQAAAREHRGGVEAGGGMGAGHAAGRQGGEQASLSWWARRRFGAL